MSLKLDANMSAVAHHIVDGPVSFPYAIDAHSAVSRFPDEWSMQPWSAEDVAAARRESGEPDVELSPEDQAAIDEHAKAVAEANERLAARREKLAAERAEAEQVAADEALVKSAPPRPEPVKPLTPAAKRRLEAEKMKNETADEMVERERIEAEKKKADQTGTL